MNASPADPSHSHSAAVAALLRWYAAMGIDDIVGLEARDFRRTVAPQTGAPATGQPAGPAPAAPALPDGTQMARQRAAGAATLEALRAAMESFDACPLKDSASRLVFADGATDASLMLIGEAPGQEEDRQGKPFVGRSGQLLDLMLKAIGYSRETAYIANIVPWRPPLNRKPELTEIEMCLPFLHRHIELIAPRLIVTLGGTASQHLLETQSSMRNLRGQIRTLRFGGHEVAVLATYHPAYLLRNPISKRAAWADMLQAKRWLADRGAA